MGQDGQLRGPPPAPPSPRGSIYPSETKTFGPSNVHPAGPGTGQHPWTNSNPASLPLEKPPSSPSHRPRRRGQPPPPGPGHSTEASPWPAASTQHTGQRVPRWCLMGQTPGGGVGWVSPLRDTQPPLAAPQLWGPAAPPAGNSWPRWGGGVTSAGGRGTEAPGDLGPGGGRTGRGRWLWGGDSPETRGRSGVSLAGAGGAAAHLRTPGGCSAAASAGRRTPASASAGSPGPAGPRPPPGKGSLLKRGPPRTGKGHHTLSLSHGHRTSLP